MAVGKGGGREGQSFMLPVFNLAESICDHTWTFFSFFSGMLEYDPAKRFSIQQIRQHK